MAPQKASTSCISDDALRIPALDKLRGRRVILASSSPRRKEILASVGIHPEIIPSTFEEDLPKSSFAGEKAIQYPAETAAHKALEVYQRLLKEDPDAERPPDMVLAADTVVVKDGEIMEKPADKADHVRMLGDLNGGECQVVTGIALVLPTLTSPGYQLHSLSETTDVQFADSPPEILEAYIASGEGMDRAGGFAIQGKGGLLVKRIEGDWNNVVGLPVFSLCTFLHELVETGQLDFDD
ncbi:Maf-like protein [Jaminaea rosea]|uniref:Maf-like protein n=1 Tax=Jaminaea rosea TaxID=1569628 RepID=A0A316V3Y0_9BASI|nr:Maf-like protein [Jaminaea rosea]PWN30913.1 Maf-like protein [Jaminaea rosea]